MIQGQKKKKNDQDRDWRKIIFLIAVAFLAVGSLALVFSATSPTYSEILRESATELSGEQAHAQIQEMLKTTLPESATNPHFFYTAWQDWFIYMRFDLPAEDVPAFLDSIDHLCFEQPLQDGDIAFLNSADNFTWWQPEQATQSISAPKCGDHPYWQILIDQSDTETSIVYIEVFSI